MEKMRLWVWIDYQDGTIDNMSIDYEPFEKQDGFTPAEIAAWKEEEKMRVWRTIPNVLSARWNDED